MAVEGWSSGGLLADETLDAAKAVWRALKGPGIAVLAFATSLVSASIFGAYHSFGFLTGNPTSEWKATLAIAGPTAAFALGALLQVGLWGTLADQVFKNKSPEGFLCTLGDAGSRIPRIAVITLVAGLLQTAVFCAPWFVVVICSPVVYVCATRPTMGWQQRLSTGWRWLKRHALTFATLFAVCFAFFGFAYLAFRVFRLMSVFLAPYLRESIAGEAFFVAVVLGGLAVVQAIYVLGFSSVFVAVERAERGVADV
jgi:hypothetical protein